jgi:hypothetical protein
MYVLTSEDCPMFQSVLSWLLVMLSRLLVMLSKLLVMLSWSLVCCHGYILIFQAVSSASKKRFRITEQGKPLLSPPFHLSSHRLSTSPLTTSPPLLSPPFHLSWHHLSTSAVTTFPPLLSPLSLCSHVHRTTVPTNLQ